MPVRSECGRRRRSRHRAWKVLRGLVVPPAVALHGDVFHNGVALAVAKKAIVAELTGQSASSADHPARGLNDVGARVDQRCMAPRTLSRAVVAAALALASAAAPAPALTLPEIPLV